MKVLIDTNVLVSAALKDRIPEQVCRTRDLRLPRRASGELDVENVEVRMPNNETELGA